MIYSLKRRFCWTGQVLGKRALLCVGVEQVVLIGRRPEYLRYFVTGAWHRRPVCPKRQDLQAPAGRCSVEHKVGHTEPPLSGLGSWCYALPTGLRLLDLIRVGAIYIKVLQIGFSTTTELDYLL